MPLLLDALEAVADFAQHGRGDIGLASATLKAASPFTS